MTATLTRPYYNRSQAARVLGVSRGSLCAWQARGEAIFTPVRPGSELNSQPQYHVEQLRLIDRALAEPERLRELDETWRTIKTALPELTLAAAHDMGFAKETA